MTDRVIRWGVLGAGHIAATVGADIAATDGNELFAVAARDPERARAFATDHGVTRAHTSYDALLADPDVDVVYIATTHAQHHEQALATLRAGKPVLIEKAFTLNARQAREVVAEARQRQLFCMEAMWLRLQPLIRRCVELAHDGTIGEPLAVRADLSKLFPYDPAHRLYDPAQGGGALLDLGVYPATFAHLLFGAPTVVQATGSLAPTGTDVTVGLQWRHEGDRVSQIHCSAAGPSPFGALVTGTEGWLRLEPRIHRPTRLVVHRSTTEGEDERVEEHAPGQGNGYRLQVAEVARCLRGGETESPLVPLDETVSILGALDEARRQLGVRYPADTEPTPSGS